MSENASTLKHESETPQAAERPAPSRVYKPHVDIVETNDAVMLTADVPGVDEHSVDVSLENKILTIRGRVEPPKFDGFTPARAEYGIGDYERAFTISDEIDQSGIEATVKDGVLKVKLPKSKQAAARKITVNAG